MPQMMCKCGQTMTLVSDIITQATRIKKDEGHERGYVCRACGKAAITYVDHQPFRIYNKNFQDAPKFTNGNTLRAIVESLRGLGKL